MKIIDEREMKNNNNNNDNKIKKIKIKITRGTEAIAKGWEISDFIERLS